MAYKVVMTSTEMVKKLKHILTLPTKYNKTYPYNLGFNHGDYWSWDCWNLYPKTLVWGWSEDIPVGEFQHKNLDTGLGDWNGWTILQCCQNISTDFSALLPAEFLLSKNKGHAGAYVGDFGYKGYYYNVIECTPSLNGGGVVPSYVDKQGNRYDRKGGARQSTGWYWHGRLPWLDYSVVEDVLAVDGWWGMATTRYTQKMFCTTIDGVVSSQPRRNKKFLPNCETTSWKFQIFGATGSQMVRQIQRLIGADQDGFMGKQTVTKLQEWLKAKKLYDGEVDGYMGPGTVKAWQRYVNQYFK